MTFKRYIDGLYRHIQSLPYSVRLFLIFLSATILILTIVDPSLTGYFIGESGPISVEMTISCAGCSDNSIPSSTEASITLDISVSGYMPDMTIAEIYPSDWTITDSGGAEVSVYDDDHFKLEWIIEDVNRTAEISYSVLTPPDQKTYTLSSEFNDNIFNIREISVLGSGSSSNLPLMGTSGSSGQSQTSGASISGSSWWDDDWDYRKEIVISDNKIAADLQDFPLFIKLNSSNFNFSDAKSDGEDIRFTDESNNNLSYELERWDSTSENAEIWVNMPYLNSTANNTIYIYYGNPAALDNQDPSSVWNSNFLGVWHLSESGTLDRNDSSKYSAHGNAVNFEGDEKIEGILDGSLNISGDDHITDISGNHLNGNGTHIAVSAWIETTTADKTIIEKKDNGQYETYQLSLGAGGSGVFSYEIAGNNVQSVTSDAVLTDGTWYHIVGIRKDTDLEIYVDGKLNGTQAGTTAGNASTSSAVDIGVRRTDGRGLTDYFDGQIDEVRIMNFSLDSNWINTTYQNIIDPEGFISISSQEIQPSEINMTFTAPTPSNGSTINKTYATINITADKNLSSCILNWDPWADYNCSHRKKLTFNTPWGSEALVDFPGLIKLDSTNINYSKARKEGIRFYDADDSTLLSHEMESWDSSGDSFVWVKVPQIDPSLSDYIYLYYNCSNNASEDASDVWSSKYVMVHHLEEQSGQINDSTGINNGTNTDASFNSSGKIDGSYDFDSNSDRIVVSNHASLNILGSKSFEAWVYRESSLGSTQEKIIDKGDDNWAGDDQYSFRIKDDLVDFVMSYGGNNANLISNTTLSTKTWYYLAAVYNKSEGKVRLYIDGQEDNNSLNFNQSTNVQTDDLYIGRGEDAHSDRRFPGLIDEARISNTSRSHSWINASYLSGSDSLISYGPEEKAVIEYPMSINNNDADTFAYYTVVNLTEDEYLYWVWCNDSLENSNQTENRTFIVNLTSANDTVPPSVQLNAPDDEYYTTSSSITFNWTATDDLDSSLDCNLTIDGTVNASVSSPNATPAAHSVSFADGTYQWNITCSDDSGNSNTSETRIFYLDSNPPTQLKPILNSSLGTNLTQENITVYNQSTSDSNPVKNIISWKRNSSSFEELILPFESSNSTFAKEYSEDNDARVHKAAYSLTAGYDGKGAYSFDGEDRGPDSDSIIVQGQGKLDFNLSEGTFTAWVKPEEFENDDGTNKNILEPSNGTGARGIEIAFSSDCGSNNSFFFWPEKGTTNYQSFAAVDFAAVSSKGQWAHIAVTWKYFSAGNNNVSMYINGIERPICGGNLSQWNEIMPVPANWTIGYDDQFTDRGFNGTIDDIRIYSTALSPEQIEFLYDNRTDKISSQETSAGDIWQACITPNDGFQDGAELCSNTLNIISCTDADNDSYAIEGGLCGPVDCNDSNASINPGAAEIENGVDDDCDGSIDEGFGGSDDTGGGGGGTRTPDIVIPPEEPELPEIIPPEMPPPEVIEPEEEEVIIDPETGEERVVPRYSDRQLDQIRKITRYEYKAPDSAFSGEDKKLSVRFTNRGNSTISNISVAVDRAETEEKPPVILHPRKILGWDFIRLTGWILKDFIREPALLRWGVSDSKGYDSLRPGESIDFDINLKTPLVRTERMIGLTFKLQSYGQTIYEETVPIRINTSEFLVLVDVHNNTRTADVYILISNQEDEEGDYSVEFDINSEPEVSYRPSSSLSGLFMSMFGGPNTLASEIYGPYKIGPKKTELFAFTYEYTDDFAGDYYIRYRLYKEDKIIRTSSGDLNLVSGYHTAHSLEDV
ncbi:DUF2341 domain-containing protein [Candidatus Woesearchaeota archaeon]|nr:DUF2341 domain-containing protein [Candidatus Woesearchaeota archaeon]